ncbi:hypothetical protein B7486_71425, partial [cyanobacterium TDX16]
QVPTAEPLAPVPPPTSLAAHREKRSRTPLLLAAAAILVVLLAVPVVALLAGGGDSSDGDQAAQVDSAADEAEEDTAAADGASSADGLDDVTALLQVAEPLDAMEAEPARPEVAPTTTVPLGEGEGETGDGADALASDFVPTPPPTDADVVTWCRSQLATPYPELADVGVRGDELTYQGDAAVAYLFVQDGEDVVLVASADTCEVLEPPTPA